MLVVCAKAVCAVAGSSGPLGPIADAVNPAADSERAMETMRRVWSTDRWFTFPKFEETARYLRQRLEQSGLGQVENGGGVADGRTQPGFWTMPLAWDARDARLEMTEPDRELLCDYQTVPASLGMWSGPTPAGGIDAQVVAVPGTNELSRKIAGRESR